MAVSLNIRFGSDLHARITRAVRERVMASKKEMDKSGKWKEAEERVLAFLPEREVDAARRLEREAGKPQYTTIQLPYSYALLSAAHTYWTSVFLARTPIMQFTGRHGESQQQVQAMEALVSYQVQIGEMLTPFYIWLYDAGKYGLGVLGLQWHEEKSLVSEIVEQEEMLFGRIPTGRKKKIKRTRRIQGYAGNKVFNVRPQDFFPDPRVPLHRLQDGEFCAVYVEIPWNEVLRRRAAGQYVNVDRLLKRDAKSESTARVPGSAELELPDPASFSPSEKNTGGTLSGYECCIDLVPKDWGLGTGDFPEKWVFTVTSDFSVVLGAEPLGAIHNKFPFLILEMEPEGYALLNRGIPEIMKPIQNTLDWLVNSHLYNVRKVLNDTFVVDPSRIVMADVLDPLPGGIIRLKASAYGEDARTAISQLPVVDVTQSHLRDMQNMIGFGERVSGINDRVMGVIERGGRRSATEARQEGAFSINRLKTISELFSAMGWAPLGQMLVQNSQQYYDTQLKLRIVGDLAQEAGGGFVDVDPEVIQGFYDFVPVDGTLPIDRFAQANLWRELFAQMRNFPQLMERYDVARIFAWVAQLTGLKNIEQFRVQVVPDEQLLVQAQQGNVVPLGPSDMERNLGLPNLPNLGNAG